MRLEAAVVVDAVRAQRQMLGRHRVESRTPSRAQWQVRRRDDLDKVHVIVCALIGGLAGRVEGIEMVVCPGQRTVLASAQASAHGLGDLRPKAQLVDLVTESVRHRRVEVVVQVVYMHVGTAEASAWRHMKVAHHLVDPQVAFNTAAFFSLRIQPLAIVFAFALLHVLTSSKGPGH